MYPFTQSGTFHPPAQIDRSEILDRVRAGLRAAGCVVTSPAPGQLAFHNPLAQDRPKFYLGRFRRGRFELEHVANGTIDLADRSGAPILHYQISTRHMAGPLVALATPPAAVAVYLGSAVALIASIAAVPAAMMLFGAGRDRADMSIFLHRALTPPRSAP